MVFYSSLIPEAVQQYTVPEGSELWHLASGTFRVPAGTACTLPLLPSPCALLLFHPAGGALLYGGAPTLRHLAVDEKEPTGVTVSLSTAGDRAMVTCMGAIGTLSDADVSDELLGQSRHLHVGGYFLQPALRPGLPVLFDRAHAAGLTTSFDTGWDDSEAWGGNLREVLAKTDVFLPNESEALAITGEQDVPAAARALARIVKVAVVKWGKHGACVCTGDTFIQLPAYRGKPVDTTGAGDAFNAGFLSAFVRGLSLDDCLRWGLASGSISVTRLGSAASCPNRADIEAMIASNDVEA